MCVGVSECGMRSSKLIVGQWNPTTRVYHFKSTGTSFYYYTIHLLRCVLAPEQLLLSALVSDPAKIINSSIVT